MSVTIEDVDLFSVDADLYVCPTNSRGIFGAGLALEFAKRWPHILEPYRQDCQAGMVSGGDVRPARLGLGPSGYRAMGGLWATKEDTHQPSRMEWVLRGAEILHHLLMVPCFTPRRRVVCPAVGCGLGGLEWARVRDTMIFIFDTAHAPADILLIPPRP